MTPASRASQHCCNNNDSCVWSCCFFCVCAALLQGVFPFTSGSLRKSLCSSKYLLQHRLPHKPAIKANHREYACTQGIKMNKEFENMTISKYPLMWHGSPVDNQMRYQVLCLPTVFGNPCNRNMQKCQPAHNHSSASSPKLLSCWYFKSICRCLAAGWHANPFSVSPWSTGTQPCSQPHLTKYSCSFRYRQAQSEPQKQIKLLTHASDSCRRTPNLRCFDVLLSPCFFINCLHLKAEKIPLHRK